MLGVGRRTKFRRKRTGRTFQLRLEEERRGRAFQAEGNSQSKGPGAEVCLVCLGNKEETRVAETEQSGQR